MVVQAPMLPFLRHCPRASSRCNSGIPSKKRAMKYGIRNAPKNRVKCNWAAWLSASHWKYCFVICLLYDSDIWGCPPSPPDRPTPWAGSWEEQSIHVRGAPQCRALCLLAWLPGRTADLSGSCFAAIHRCSQWYWALAGRALHISTALFPISYFPGSNCVIISANYPLLSLSPGVFASWTVDSSACLDTLLIKPCLHWTGFLRISSHIYSTAKHNVTLGKTILIFHESNTESMLSANCYCLQIWRYDGVRRNS